MQDFNGKIALVTGGGSGIGEALAIALAREGAKVGVSDVDADRAESAARNCLAEGGEAIAVRLDVTDAESWAHAAEEVERRFGPVDILCSNAGVTGSARHLLDTPISLFRWVYDVNVFGALTGVKLLAPGMMVRGTGHILFTASIAGLFSSPDRADYSSSKHASVALADVLRQELQPHGVGVSVLCPAAVDTPIWESTLRQMTPDIRSQLGIDAGAAYGGKATGIKSAEEVADITLAGIRDGQFFIFTHGETAAWLRPRSDLVAQGLAALS